MIRWWSFLLAGAAIAPACSSTTKSVEGDDGCEPSAFRCLGDELQRCDEDGAAWAVEALCVPGTCIDGEGSCTALDNTGGATASSGGGAGGSGGANGDGGTSDSMGGPSTTSGGSAGDAGVGGSAGGPGTTGTTGGGSGGDGGSGASTNGPSTTGGGSGGDGGISSSSTGGASATGGGAGGVGGATISVSTTWEPELFCSPNPCSSDRRCDEDADQCVCDGCVIGGACVAADAANPDNSCQVCDPDESTSAYSADVGTACGDSETECSGEDTCNSSAVCQANHVADRIECSDGYCEGGDCKLPVFDCIAPDPPAFDGEELEMFVNLTDPPTPTGGALPSGRYTPFRVQYYGDQPSTTSLYSFEIQGIFAQVAMQPYPPWIPQIEFAGIFTPIDDTLEFDVERCDPQYDIDVPVLEYSATANGMLTFETDVYGTRIVISYLRE